MSEDSPDKKNARQANLKADLFDEEHNSREIGESNYNIVCLHLVVMKKPKIFLRIKKYFRCGFYAWVLYPYFTVARFHSSKSGAAFCRRCKWWVKSSKPLGDGQC